ncbi:hypothetical protein Tco_1213985 [Tanacetum coccineum]
MPYEQLAKFLKEKCGCYFQGLYYQVPSQDLERGLVRVSDDRSIYYILDVEETFGPPKKRTSTIDGVEARNSTTQGVEARTNTKDKGKEMVIEDASDVVETRRCTVKLDFKTEYESGDDSDYQSNKPVDCLIPSEDELIELRNRMKTNRKEKAKAKDKPDSGMNEPNEENSMPADNVRGKTFEEHDIYMNELLKSLKTADKDGITKDPFISIEKHMESVAQFKECLTNYALANGFSLWHEMSGEERVVAKCGQRPPRVSAPEKGKQRKQTKLLESYVPAWFETYMYFVTYHNYVKPVLGMNFWPDQSMYSTVLPPKPRKIPGRPRKKRIRAIGRPKKKQPVDDFEDVDVVKRGPVRDEGASGTRGGRGAGGSGGANGLRSRGTAGSRGGASGSIGRGTGGSNRRHVSTAGTQKDKTQVEDQVEQTKDQAEIDLTQLEQTQEPTQDQVHPQEQPQQAALRMPSARIFQRKLGKQGSSQNTALNLD